MILRIIAALIFFSGTAVASDVFTTGSFEPSNQKFEKRQCNDPGKLPPEKRKQCEAFESLSPEQRKALEEELNKTEGGITLEGDLEGLGAPEGKGTTPAPGRNVVKQEPAPAHHDNKHLYDNKPLFERYRELVPYQNIDTELKPFGYDFFSSSEVKLSSQDDIPVSPGYVVGPGDEIKLALWGRANAQFSLTVDRDGNVIVPQIGPLRVAGMTYSAMTGFLKSKAEQIIGTKLSVAMGGLKSFQVFILGEVRRPGSYALDSFSTVTTALLAAGGPSEIGSLRNIQLKRKNKVIAEIDLYDLLLKGDKSEDRVLESGDVIFVSTAGPLVGIAGNVKRPAIYEMKGKSDLSSVFELAGGLTPTAYTQHIQVARIQKNEKHIVVDINDRELGKANNFMLQDGDLVKVFPIVDWDGNAVYLNGAVKRPGKYEYKPGMRVKDLIKDFEDLTEETHLEYAFVKRLNADMKTELIPFSPGRLLASGSEADNITLRPQDNIYVFSKSFFKDRSLVTVDGEVRKPGTFDFVEKIRVKDAILLAGGLKKDASLKKGEIIRVEDDKGFATLYFNVEKALSEDPLENLSLKEDDKVIIHSLWEDKWKEEVVIQGEVLRPGRYLLTTGMRVSDLVFKAGNLLESAYPEKAELASHSFADGGGAVEYRKVDLRKALEGDQTHDLVLKPHDTLFIKKAVGWGKELYVKINGEVAFPGKYIIRKGDSLSNLIERAGGPTDRAYLKGAVFIRESVKELQQRQISDAVERLESQLLTRSASAIETALTPEDAKQKEFATEQMKQLIGKMKAAKAMGRMVVRLEEMDRFKGSVHDIALEGGDELTIPTMPSSVQVIGSVYNSTSFIYEPDQSVSDYITKAGGTTGGAEVRETFLLKVDGSAKSRRKGGFFFMSSTLDPGDTVVVPEKLERIAWLKETKDFTQILYQIAVTAGVLIVAF